MSTNMETAIEFANKVRNELRHLTTEQITDLTDGLEADIASSLDDGADIGSAEKYASDLLVAAGLPTGLAAPKSVIAWRVHFENVLNWLKLTTADLVPAWWIARAWIVTQIFGALFSASNSRFLLFGEWGEKPNVFIIVFVLAIILSIRIGQSSRRKLSLLVVVANTLLLVAAIPVLKSVGYLDAWEPMPNVPADMRSFDLCPHAEAPQVKGYEVLDAIRVLRAHEIESAYIDFETGKVLPEVRNGWLVVDEYVNSWSSACKVVNVVLSINTNPSPNQSYVLTTTTMAQVLGTPGTTTTTPKATTTTKP